MRTPEGRPKDTRTREGRDNFVLDLIREDKANEKAQKVGLLHAFRADFDLRNKIYCANLVLEDYPDKDLDKDLLPAILKMPKYCDMLRNAIEYDVAMKHLHNSLTKTFKDILDSPVAGCALVPSKDSPPSSPDEPLPDLDPDLDNAPIPSDVYLASIDPELEDALAGIPPLDEMYPFTEDTTHACDLSMSDACTACVNKYKPTMDQLPKGPFDNLPGFSCVPGTNPLVQPGPDGRYNFKAIKGSLSSSDDNLVSKGFDNTTGVAKGFDKPVAKVCGQQSFIVPKGTFPGSYPGINSPLIQMTHKQYADTILAQTPLREGAVRYTRYCSCDESCKYCAAKSIKSINK